MPPLPIRSRHVATVAVLALLAACATPQEREAASGHVVAPGAAGVLRGAPIVVACDGNDAALRDVCGEQLVAEASVRGSRAIAAASGAGEQRWLADARAAGARAVLVMTPTPVAVQEPGPALSIGIGGFGFGRGSAVGGGVGVTTPLGTPRIATGFVATARVIDVASGRTLWSARSGAPPSSDLAVQFGGLAMSLLDIADRDGLY